MMIPLILAVSWLLLPRPAAALGEEPLRLREPAQQCWAAGKEMARCEQTVTGVLRRFEELTDRPGMAWSLYLRAHVRDSLGRSGEADADRERSAELFVEALQDSAADAASRREIEWEYAQLLAGLKDGALRRGDLVRAREYAFARLEIAERRGDPGLLAVSHQDVAEVARRTGLLDIAAQAYDAAARHYEEAGNLGAVRVSTTSAAEVRREAEAAARLEAETSRVEARSLESEEKAMDEVRFQLRCVFYRNKLKSRPDEVFSVLVKEGESFGSVDFGGRKGQPFKLLRVVDAGAAEVGFDKALVIRDFGDKGPAVATVGQQEIKFMTPTTDSGVAIYIRVAP